MLVKNKMKSLKYLIGAGIIALSSCNPEIPNIPEIPSLPPIVPIIPYEEIEEEQEPIIDEPVLEEPIIPPRDDVYVSILFNDHKVGDKFMYIGRIQNKHLEHILISNETGGLEWNLMRGDEVISNSSLINFSVTLKEQGYVEIEQLDNQIEITTENTIIEYGGETYELPFKIKYKIDYDTHIFQESGTYVLEFLIGYVLNKETYKARYVSEFEVNQ